MPAALPLILRYFVISRLLLTLVAGVSRLVLKRVPIGDVWHLPLELWSAWDSGWYLQIVKHGYSAATHPRLPGQANYAFYPLYPLLTKLLGVALGESYLLSALIVSNVCLIGAALILYRLTEADYGEHVARLVNRYFFLFPSSLYLSGALSESLYLLLVLAVLALARSGRWLLVGLLGFLLALCRPPGLLIVIPLLYEYWRGSGRSLRNLRWDVLALALIPLGTLCFALYVYHLTGEPWAFIRVQAAWNRVLSNPVSVVLRAIMGPDKDDRFNAIYGTLVLSIVVLGWRKLRPSYLIFGLYSILVPLSSHATSMVRMNSVLFPAWIVLARSFEKPVVHLILSLVFAVIQAVFMVLWSNHYGVAV